MDKFDYMDFIINIGYALLAVLVIWALFSPSDPTPAIQEKRETCFEVAKTQADTCDCVMIYNPQK